MATTKVTRNGQITLRKEIREELGIEEGTRLVINRLGDMILIKKVDKESWDDVESFLPDDFKESMRDYREASKPRW